MPSQSTLAHVQSRFWSYVIKTPDCWIWIGAVGRAGYGKFSPFGRVGGNHYAHRLSYQWLVGPIPAGLVIDHLCRQHACVNPQHLEAVTPRENVMRGENVKVILSRSGYCLRGHEANDDNVYRVKESGRIAYCRPCRRERRREAYHGKKVHGPGDTTG